MATVSDPLSLELLQLLRMDDETCELLQTMLPEEIPATHDQIEDSLQRLQCRGWVRSSTSVDGVWWSLTDDGRAAAEGFEPD
jgi:hypothetical protein